MFGRWLCWLYRWRATARVAMLLSMVGSQAPVALAQATAAPVSPASARIWFYRDYDPYVNRNYATVKLNGTVAGSVEPYGGVLYRDVAPGRYHLTAESAGVDCGQDADVDLASGQEAYVKILNLPSWASGGGFGGYRRDTYYLRVMPTATARIEVARRPY